MSLSIVVLVTPRLFNAPTKTLQQRPMAALQRGRCACSVRACYTSCSTMHSVASKDVAGCIEASVFLLSFLYAAERAPFSGSLQRNLSFCCLLCWG